MEAVLPRSDRRQTVSDAHQALPVHRSDVAVLGSTISALAAAHECAKIGVSVVVLHTDEFVPPGPVADPTGTLAELMDSLGVPYERTPPPDPLVASVALDAGPTRSAGDTAPNFVKIPTGAVYGIPPSPLSAEISEPLGTGAALRAYLDRIAPVLKVGKEENFARLVTARVGRKILTEFVEPLVRHRFGRPAIELETALVAPGLNEALTRVGSLTGATLAYVDRFVARESRVRPAAGWESLAAALVERIEFFGGTTLDMSNTDDLQLSRRDSGWTVEHETVRVEALAVIHSADATLISDENNSDDHGDDPAQFRAYATLAVERPEWWPSAEVIVTLTDGGATVGSAAIFEVAGAWFMELRTAVSDARPDDRKTKRLLDCACEALHLTPAVLDSFADADPVDAEDAPQASIIVAPACSETKRATEESEPSRVLIPGETGDFGLSEAVQVATDRAITLRRIITGIAEEPLE